MRRTTLVLALAVALSMLVAVPAVGLSTGSDDGDVNNQPGESQATNATQASGTAPGEQLSGVVGVQEMELEGDIQQRSFGMQMASAESQERQAAVVAERLDAVEQRLTALEERKATLERQFENGEISDGKYSASMARMAAQTHVLQQMTNQSEHAAGQLPAHLLEEQNVSTERIQMIRQHAGELSGPELSEIARGIAGPKMGHTPVDDRPVEVPDRPERHGGNDRHGDSGADDRHGGPGNGMDPGDETDDEDTDDDEDDE